MKTFVRSVVTGFALALGATLFRKLAKKVGLEEDASKASGVNTAVGGGVSSGTATPPVSEPTPT